METSDENVNDLLTNHNNRVFFCFCVEVDKYNCYYIIIDTDLTHHT